MEFSITLEALWEDFESKVSPSTAEGGQQTLQDRLDICSNLSQSLVSELQDHQTRLQDIEGQQKTFHNMNEELQAKVLSIEEQVDNWVLEFGSLS